jgi:hypothetical protein
MGYNLVAPPPFPLPWFVFRTMSTQQHSHAQHDGTSAVVSCFALVS